MIKLVPKKFIGIYKKRLSFKWNEFRVYFGFDFFWIHILNSIPSLPTGRCLTLAPWNRTRICLARPLWFYPSSSLFSSFFESVIKVPLHFRSSSYAFSTSIFFFFDSFAFFFFFFFLPFPSLLSFYSHSSVVFVLSVFSLRPGVGELWGRIASASHWRRGHIAHRFFLDKFSGIVEFLEIWKLW